MASPKKTAKKPKVAKTAARPTGKSAKAAKPAPKAKKVAPKKATPKPAAKKAAPKVAAKKAPAKAQKVAPKKAAKPAPKKAAPVKAAPKKAAPKPAAAKPAAAKPIAKPKAAPKPAAAKPAAAKPAAAKPAAAKPAAAKAAPEKAAPKPAAAKPTPAEAAPKAKAAPAPKPAPEPAPTLAPVAAAPEPAPAPAPKKVKKAPAPKPAPAAAPAAEAAEPKKAAVKKRKLIPSTSMAATPVIRPMGEMIAPAAAPPPPPAKPGHVDHQILSAITYGLFAAVNKAFGFAGQSVVKNASLRMLEYGYKRGWLPPKSRQPVPALNEYFSRLEAMGYADKIHVGKRGDNYALEITGLADYDALHELKGMHYPLLPFFLGEMLQAIVDQYFGLRVTMSPMEINEAKRGASIGFELHEKPVQADASKLLTTATYDLSDFEE